MKIKATVLAFATGAALFSSAAGQIPEPSTVFYGRIVHESGGQQYLLTRGALAWTFRSSAGGGREYRFVTALQPLAGGQFSYRLDIPHEVLAYALSTSEGTVPLTSAGWLFESVQMTVDGHPLSVMGGGDASFIAQQSSRAATHRLDLQVGSGLPDSDGDGIPDWWEDQTGTDKWDPNDPAKSSTGGDSSDDDLESGMTLAKWREQHFPGAASDLDEFAAEDTDSDGIKNLLEYAYDLPPAHADDPGDPQLPRSALREGRLVIEFNQRSNATDLEYRIELSRDLVQWQDATDLFDQQMVEERERKMVRMAARHKDDIAQETQGYFRVRVYRK